MQWQTNGDNMDLDRVEIVDMLTQWGIANRVHNICGWYSVGPLGRIENENVHRVNIPQPNTEKAVQGLSEDDKPIRVGADPKHIDRYKVQAIDNIIMIAAPLEKSVARELYINIPVNPRNRRQKGESWVAAKLNIGRKAVRNSHSRLILLIQNELLKHV